MSHIHWVARQNKLEIPRDKDEVNKWEIHECDGRAHDPGTMVAPLTPKPTRKTEDLVKATTTIVLCHEEDTTLRKWPLTRYCWTSCILETKTKVGSTAAKAPVPRTQTNIDETPTAPKSHTHLSHECVGRVCDPEVTDAPPTPKPTRKALVREPSTIVSHREEDAALRKWSLPRYCCARCILEVWGSQGPSHTGWNIIHTKSIQ